MPLNKKGQVSFELLMLTAIIFVTAIWTSGYYLDIKDSTLAIQLSKAQSILEIEEEDDLYTIEKIEFVEVTNEQIDITVRFCPDSTIDFDEGALATKITQNTKYTTANIGVVDGSC